MFENFFKKQPQPEIIEFSLSDERKTKIVSDAKSFQDLISAIDQIGEIKRDKASNLKLLEALSYPEAEKKAILDLQKALDTFPRYQDEIDVCLDLITYAYGIKAKARQIADASKLRMLD